MALVSLSSSGKTSEIECMGLSLLYLLKTTTITIQLKEYKKEWFSLYKVLGIDMRENFAKVFMIDKRLKKRGTSALYDNFSQHIYRINQTFIKLCNLTGDIKYIPSHRSQYEPKKMLDDITKKLQTAPLFSFEFGHIYKFFGSPDITEYIQKILAQNTTIYKEFVLAQNKAKDYAFYETEITHGLHGQTFAQDWDGFNVIQRCNVVNQIMCPENIFNVESYTEYKSSCPRSPCVATDCYCTLNYAKYAEHWLYHCDKFSVLSKTIRDKIEKNVKPINHKNNLLKVIIPFWYIPNIKEVNDKIRIGGTLCEKEFDKLSNKLNVISSLFIMQLLMAKKMLKRLKRVSKSQEFITFSRENTYDSADFVYYQWLKYAQKNTTDDDTKKFTNEMKRFLPLILWYIKRKELFSDATSCSRIQNNLLVNILYCNQVSSNLTEREQMANTAYSVIFE